jgi:hypothetical protein
MTQFQSMRRKTFAQQADVSQNTDYSTIISFPTRGYNCMVKMVRTNMNKFPTPSWLRILSSSWLTNSIAVIATIYACLSFSLPTRATTVLGPPCGTASQCAATSSNCPAGEGWIFLQTKTVRCCLPSAANPQYYFVYDITINVFHKQNPGDDLRCYKRSSYVSTGVNCNPNTPCVSEGE